MNKDEKILNKILARTEIKGIQIKTEEVKLCLLSDDI